MIMAHFSDLHYGRSQSDDVWLEKMIADAVSPPRKHHYIVLAPAPRICFTSKYEKENKNNTDDSPRSRGPGSHQAHGL